jgi:antitoxin component YwqK of YwqJK toxin-antitoxin module
LNKFFLKFSGELQYTVTYVVDLMQGEMKIYSESGELGATVNFVDGVEQYYGSWNQ